MEFHFEIVLSHSVNMEFHFEIVLSHSVEMEFQSEIALSHSVEMKFQHNTQDLLTVKPSASPQKALSAK